MSSHQEKVSLLSEMIAFAVIDGELHDREYDFLHLISEELEIDKELFLALFDKTKNHVIIKDEFSRIIHFYRLALLMHCDGVLHKREKAAIHEMGITMGLNPFAMSRILKLMEESTSKIIAPEKLICAFQEQHN